MARSPAILALALLLAGCSSAPVAKTATARPTPSATASPSPTPLADVQRIDVLSTGVGTWQLVTVPVALIHSDASQSVAAGVIVHLTPTRGGHPLTALQTPVLTLYPGQTLVVAANCTDTCLGADSALVTVQPGTWASQPGTPLTSVAGAFTCTESCHGHGQWDVPVTVGGPALVQDEQVDLFASCANPAGAIIGGGQRTLLWPQSGGSLDLDVPVIVSTPPASCQVGATTSN